MRDSRPVCQTCNTWITWTADPAQAGARWIGDQDTTPGYCWRANGPHTPPRPQLAPCEQPEPYADAAALVGYILAHRHAAILANVDRARLERCAALVTVAQARPPVRKDTPPTEEHAPTVEALATVARILAAALRSWDAQQPPATPWDAYPEGSDHGSRPVAPTPPPAPLPPAHHQDPRQPLDPRPSAPVAAMPTAASSRPSAPAVSALDLF